MEKSVFLIASILLALAAPCQDHIITWKNDTIPCKLTPDPRKAGLKPAGNYRNGYFRIAALYPNDSLRVYDAGQIKGYYRKEHGKGLLCDGHFDALQLAEAAGNLVTEAERRSFAWAFLLRVQHGRFASLYKLMKWGRRLNTYFYIVKRGKGNAGTAQLITGNKRIRSLLFEDDIREEMVKAAGKTKNMDSLVAIYNRVREKAAKQAE